MKICKHRKFKIVKHREAGQYSLRCLKCGAAWSDKIRMIERLRKYFKEINK